MTPRFRLVILATGAIVLSVAVGPAAASAPSPSRLYEPLLGSSFAQWQLPAGGNSSKTSWRTQIGADPRRAACYTDKIQFSCTGTAVVHSGGKTIHWKGLRCFNWNTFDVTSGPVPFNTGFHLMVFSRSGGRVRDGHYRHFLLSFSIGGTDYSDFTDTSLTISHGGTRGSFSVTVFERFKGSFRC